MSRYTEPLDAGGRFLTLATRSARSVEESDELRALVTRLGVERCRALAREAYVAPLTDDALYADVPTAAAQIEHDRDTNARRVTGLIDALRAVTRHLNGVPWCAVEGAAVLLGTEMARAAYPSGDLDIMVEAGHEALVERAFESEGFEHQDRRSRPTCRVEYTRIDQGVRQWLEAGTEIFDRMWVPLSFRSLTHAWLARRVPSHEPGLFVLSPTDALVVAAIHASMHSFVRAPGLRLYAEIDRLARQDVDWDVVIRDLRECRASARALVSLRIAAGLLGSPVPDSVCGRLEAEAPSAKAVLALIARHGVVAPKRPLGRASTIALDRRLDGRPLRSWLRDTLAPSESWLREHFARDKGVSSVAHLHARRVGAFVARWRPR